MTNDQHEDEHGSEYLEPCELCKRGGQVYQCHCGREVCVDCWDVHSWNCVRCELDVEIAEHKRDQQRDERNSQ
jgi:hypothetical protein